MIRIADEPPSEAGDYKCRHERNPWQVCMVWDRGTEFHGEDLWVRRGDGRLQPLRVMVSNGWQFSTRIPDPVAETEGEG